MNLARVYEALLQARQELIKDPRQGVEGLDTAPLHQASGAADYRISLGRLRAERWRFWIVDGSGPEAAALLGMGSPVCAAWPLVMARPKESNDD
jgi:hypothetical protein